MALQWPHKYEAIAMDAQQALPISLWYGMYTLIKEQKNSSEYSKMVRKHNLFSSYRQPRLIGTHGEN